MGLTPARARIMHARRPVVVRIQQIRTTPRAAIITPGRSIRDPRLTAMAAMAATAKAKQTPKDATMEAKQTPKDATVEARPTAQICPRLTSRKQSQLKLDGAFH